MTLARTLALGLGTLAAALTVSAAPAVTRQAQAPEITVYKGPT